MKKIALIILAVSLLVMTACNKTETDEPLQDSQKNTVTESVWVNWTEDEKIYDKCLNYDTLVISSVRHLPVYLLSSTADVKHFIRDFSDNLTLSQGTDSFTEVMAKYDDAFFKDNSIMMAYVTAGSGSLRFGVDCVVFEGTYVCMNVIQTNSPEIGTCDMAGWLVMSAVSKSSLKGYETFDAVMVQQPLSQ
ncbi:MAG: hypothetical protein IJG49_06310 [Erysipelotrichaceae bacterium]|nr:hypothetical protein [Erysipelotrichaceae bacterium]